MSMMSMMYFQEVSAVSQAWEEACKCSSFLKATDIAEKVTKHLRWVGSGASKGFSKFSHHESS